MCPKRCQRMCEHFPLYLGELMHTLGLVFASGGQKSNLKMIPSLVASFSQSISPFELLPIPFSPDLIFFENYFFQFPTPLFKRKHIFVFFWRVLRGGQTHLIISISNASIFCLGGMGVYLFSQMQSYRNPVTKRASLFEHMLYGDNLLYENKTSLENVILCEDKIPYMKRIDSSSKHP